MVNNEESTNKDNIIEQIKSEEDDILIDNSNYEIISYGADYTLSVIFEKMKKQEIIIPSFQRKYVWSQKQASKLIESFLLGLPVPGIFLSKNVDTGELLVVDGQQRLKTIEAYINEKFPLTEDIFYLISVKDKWEGKKYTELDLVDKRRFDDSVLRATIIQQVNPKDSTSVYHIFERLNTGGTSLQSQEIRNCIYFGKFNNMLHDLNKNPIWRELYNSPNPNFRMKDEELILRFFALYYDLEKYTKPMNEFLSKFMLKNRNLTDEKKEEMKNIFIKTISIIKEKIGFYAFRPTRNLNMAAFDSVMYVFSKFQHSIKDDIQNNIKNLFQDVAYLKAITEGTTDFDTLNTRIKIAKRFLTNEK